MWFFTVVGASELRAPTKLHIYCDKLQNPRCYNCLSDGVAGPLCDLLDDSERKEWLEPERFKLVIFLPLVVARLVLQVHSMVSRFHPRLMRSSVCQSGSEHQFTHNCGRNLMSPWVQTFGRPLIGLLNVHSRCLIARTWPTQQGA